MKGKKITSKNLVITNRKLPHWQIGGSWYFITFRTKRLALSPAARTMVVDAIMYNFKKRYELAAATVMPDHVHMIFRPLDKPGGSYCPLPEILKSVKGFSSRRIKASVGAAPVWQTESFDRIIRTPEEWREKYEYVRNNAVKAGIVERPEDYPWLVCGEGFANDW